MNDKKYALHGWVPPVMHPRDPDYCEYGCPICRAARRGNRLARLVQNIELFVTRGGCGWGRARQEKYGVAPHEPRPQAPEAGGDAARTPPENQ